MFHIPVSKAGVQKDSYNLLAINVTVSHQDNNAYVWVVKSNILCDNYLYLNIAFYVRMLTLYTLIL